MEKSKFVWLVILLTLILFFNLKGIPQIITGLIIFILLIISSALDTKDWSNKFLEQIGIAVIAGLVVSLFRDISLKLINNSLLISMYIIGFVVGLVLLLMGVLGRDPDAKKGEIRLKRKV